MLVDATKEGDLVTTAFEVDRTDLQRTRIVSSPSLTLGAGEVRLRIGQFALTANNVTYAVFGDGMKYWDFFPAAPPEPTDPAEAGAWGRIPVWGFADVIESSHGDVEEGQRVYGYFPMADELIVLADRVDESGFTDTAEHRQPMAATYNRYQYCSADPAYRDDREPQQMVLWPLFYTSFMIDDLLGDNELFGAGTVVISSASSKTAIGAARLLSQRPGVRVVGLTSSANQSFVESLDCYHDVVSYDDLATLGGTEVAYVDIAGSGDVTAAVHERFGEHLVYSMMVGASHWDQVGQPTPTLPGPAPQFFFAPAQIAKRTADWGREVLQQRVVDAWSRYSAWTDGWLQIVESVGAAEVERTYRGLLGGKVDPRVGLVCAMVESDAVADEPSRVRS
jgi:hypothetical protein